MRQRTTKRTMTTLAVMAMATLGGCRTFTITSVPSGARVWIDGAEVGRTPMTTHARWLESGEKKLITLAHPECHTLTTQLRVRPVWEVVYPLPYVTAVMRRPIENQRYVLARRDGGEHAQLRTGRTAAHVSRTVKPRRSRRSRRSRN